MLTGRLHDTPWTTLDKILRKRAANPAAQTFPVRKPESARKNTVARRVCSSNVGHSVEEVSWTTEVLRIAPDQYRQIGSLSHQLRRLLRHPSSGLLSGYFITMHERLANRELLLSILGFWRKQRRLEEVSKSTDGHPL